MWEMSKPGSETEGLFLRIHQKDYYEVRPDQDIPIEWMPDVCSPHPQIIMLPSDIECHSVSIASN